MNILETKKKQEKEEISLENINSLYFDLKTAQSLAETSMQTLYTYANNPNNNIEMVKYRNKNYMHIDDIEFIKNEVAITKSVRNSSAVVIKKEQELDKEVQNNEIETLLNEKSKLEIELHFEKEQSLNLRNTIEALKDDAIRKENDFYNLLNEKLKEKEDNTLLRETISSLKTQLEASEKVRKELSDNLSIEKEKLSREATERLKLMNENTEIKKELSAALEQVKLLEIFKDKANELSREKDELYNNQISSLQKHNEDINENYNKVMNKIDKFIDSQQAFQVMLAQKEQTNQQMIEEKSKKGFFSRIFDNK